MPTLAASLFQRSNMRNYPARFGVSATHFCNAATRNGKGCTLKYCLFHVEIPRRLLRVCNQPINAFVYCVARYENFAVNQKASIFVSYVIKEFARAFSGAYIELWMHLGSLESTQEARVTLGYRLVQLSRIFRALQTSRVHL